jgi:hypothetical protein
LALFWLPTNFLFSFDFQFFISWEGDECDDMVSKTSGEMFLRFIQLMDWHHLRRIFLSARGRFVMG